MKSSITSLLAALVLCACVADSYQRVPQPPLDREVSSPAVARVYVLRMPQLAGRIRGVRVEGAQGEIGRMGRDHYLCWECAPGRSLVTLHYDGPAIERDSEGLIDLECEAGKVYYYGITIDTAWNRPVVRMLAADEARDLIAKQSPAPAQ